MCGRVTSYTACKRIAVKPGQWIVLPGAGGGLGHFAVQYAKAMDMRVIAIDGGDEKRDLFKWLGVEAYIDFTAGKDIAAEVMALTMYGAHRCDCHGGRGTRVCWASCGREARWSWWPCRRTLLS